MRHESFRVYLELGLAPWLIPLEGKIPWSGWRGREHQPSEELGLSAIEGPGNVGLALGVGPGFVVLDDDRAKHGIDTRGWPVPPTDMVVATAGAGSTTTTPSTPRPKASPHRPLASLTTSTSCPPASSV